MVGWTSFTHLKGKEKETHVSLKSWQMSLLTYSSHIARARSCCASVDFAIFGFWRLGPSVLGAWLSNTLADSSFNVVVRPEKNDGLDDFFVVDVPFLAGIVGDGGGGRGRCCRESRKKEQEWEASLGGLACPSWKAARLLYPSPAAPSRRPGRILSSL